MEIPRVGKEQPAHLCLLPDQPFIGGTCYKLKSKMNKITSSSVAENNTGSIIKAINSKSAL